MLEVATEQSSEWKTTKTKRKRLVLFRLHFHATHRQQRSLMIKEREEEIKLMLREWVRAGKNRASFKYGWSRKDWVRSWVAGDWSSRSIQPWEEPGNNATDTGKWRTEILSTEESWMWEQRMRGHLVLSQPSRAIWKELKVAPGRLTVGCASECSLDVVTHLMLSRPILASKISLLQLRMKSYNLLFSPVTKRPVSVSFEQGSNHKERWETEISSLQSPEVWQSQPCRKGGGSENSCKVDKGVPVRVYPGVHSPASRN